jgi:Domain of unknown function (DUF5679)
MEAYCVKCKTKRTIKDGTIGTTKNNRKIMKGLCSNCGTKMNRFLSNNQQEQQIIKKKRGRKKKESIEM